jgi:hypothetical protein
VQVVRTFDVVKVSLSAVVSGERIDKRAILVPL